MTDPAATPARLADLALESGDELRAVLMALEGGEIVLENRQVARVIELLAHPSKEVRRRAAGAVATAISSGAIPASFLVGALEDPSPSRRFGAAFALHKAGHTSERMLETAIAALGDGDGDVRWAAAGILCAAAAADPVLRTKLNELTQDAQVERRKMALYCLRDLGETAPDLYMAATLDADPNVRVAGLAGLGRAGGAGAAVLARLVEMGRGDEVVGVRRAAIGVLGMVGLHDAGARAALAAFADDDDPHASRAARAALARVDAAPGNSKGS